jgi:hypothetical protein
VNSGDSLADAKEQVVASLSASWQEELSQQLIVDLTNGELAGFLAGNGASLPYFAQGGVRWVTTGPSAAHLHREIELLRAWILPSYAWEDPHPFVSPGEETGSLSAALFSLSPAGYFRWRSTKVEFAAVVRRLARMRAVLARRPEHLLDTIPSLLELRQQFRTALVTGDRDAADAVIGKIDHYQLDSAVNTQLMRVGMRDRFGEYQAIINDPALDRLLELRIPSAVRTALIRAFYEVHILPVEADGPEAAASAYAAHAHEMIGPLLRFAIPEDGPEIARSLAYHAWATTDKKAAAALLQLSDGFVAPLLRTLVPEVPSSVESAHDLVRAFSAAIEREDVRAIQALAPSLLAGLKAGAPNIGMDIVDVVRGALDALPNPGLAHEWELAAPERAIAPAMPQSWAELLVRLRERSWDAAERFLALDHTERPGPEIMDPGEIDAAIATLEELLTDPAFGPTAAQRRITGAALPAFIEDFVSEAQFPRANFAPLYLQLLHLWSEHKRGSAYGPDGQLLLVLADAVLQHLGLAQQDVADALVEWWSARPVRAALPFLLEAVEVLLNFMADDQRAQQLWLAGATLAARHAEALAPSERSLWRLLGLQAGYEDATVEAVFPAPEVSGADDVRPDPVRQLGLRKIAIVSLHQRAADDARSLIEERTDATVFVVSELVAGPATRSAQSADVILFVWAATKHAVFRAFDSVRERMVYVQGSGAGSIVLALERWAAKRMEEAASSPTPP